MPNFQQSLEDLHLTRPTLLLDKNRVTRNIKRMKQKADRAGLRFRPHPCPRSTG